MTTSSMQSRTALMRRTKSDLVDELMALQGRLSAEETGGSKAENPLADGMQPERVQRDLLDGVPAPILVTSCDTHEILFANRIGIQSYSFGDDPVGHSVLDGYEDPQRRLDLVERLKSGDDVVQFETRLRDAEGEPRWGLVTAQLIRYQGRDAVLAVTQDIDEIKQLERALKESEERLETFIDHTPAAITLKDAEGRYSLANKRFCEIHNLPPEDIIGKTTHDLYPDVLANVFTDQDQATFAKASPMEFEFDSTSASGMERNYLSIKFPVFGSADDVAGIGAVSLDITERKQAEQAQAASEELLKTFIDHTSAAITLKDAEGRYFLANKYFCEIHRQKPENIIGKTTYDLYPEALAEFFIAQDRKTIDTASPLEFEFDSTGVGGKESNFLGIRFPVVGPDDEIIGIGAVSLDITERKQAEEELARKEAQLSLALDTMTDGIWVVDSDMRFSMFNDRYRELMGLSEDVLYIGATVADVSLHVAMSGAWGAGDPKELAARRVAAIGSDQEIISETEIAGGRILETRKAPRSGGGAVALVTDITERKHAEADLRKLNDELEQQVEFRTQELRQAETRILDAIDHVSEGFVLFDADDRIELCNDKYRETYGYSRADVEIGTPLAQLIEWDVERGTLTNDEAAATLRRRSQTYGKTEETFEVPLADGRWVQIRDRRTSSGGTVSIHADITERKMAEAEIKESETRLQQILESSPIGIAILAQEDGARLFVNRALVDMFGADSPDKLKQEDISESWTDPSRLAEAWSAFQSENVLVNFEAERKRIDGSKWWVLMHTQPISFEGVDAGVVWHVDITERKNADKELQIAKAEAEAANRAKSEFLSSMSHELRTPLNAIIGFSQYVSEDEDDPLNEEQQECVGQVMKAGHHLLELIDDVLDLSKIEIGAVTLSIEPVDVSEVIDECVELTASFASRHGITLESMVGGAGLPPILVDRTRYKQVLLNFLSNAVKYNRENGSITIEPARPSAETIRVGVTDSGEGIPEDRLQNIFNPFDRLGAENSDIEGTGIGLTIARRLVEQMGGEIGIESTVGKGSTFWISFPVAETVARAVTEEEPIRAAVQSEGVGGTVLYVEDNPANLELVRKIIGRHQRFALIDAPTAELGIELARQHQPDIIILDINLPGMDGLAALAQLRKITETSDIPVIALSAAAMPRDIEKGKEAGFVDYLTKPIDATVLVQAIDSVLQGIAD